MDKSAGSCIMNKKIFPGAGDWGFTGDMPGLYEIKEMSYAVYSVPCR